MTRYILSLGAGVNSTAMLLYILDHSIPLDEVVFADTGNEKPETYRYITEWIEPFLKKQGIPLTVVRARRIREKIGSMVIFEDATLEGRCIRGHTIPDRNFRWSTRDFKIRPLYKHFKRTIEKIGNMSIIEDVVCYVGIAYDEIERVKQEYGQAWLTKQWPLIDAKMTRRDCLALLLDHGWAAPVKSGCWFCPFANLQDWRWLYKNHPDLWEKAKQIEQNGSKYPQFTLFYGGTLEELEKRLKDEKNQLPLTGFIEQECTGYCIT